MEDYSLKLNLAYMVETFYKPKTLIEHLLDESKLALYMILPLFIFTIGYELMYIHAFIINEPFFNPIPNITPIPDEYYRFFLVFAFPVIHLMCFLIFYLILKAFSRIDKSDNIDPVKITYFYIFVGNTLGLIALGIDIISYIIPSEYWMYIHPICGLIGGIYLVYFIHKQSRIKKSNATIITIIGFVCFFTFRMLLVR